MRMRDRTVGEKNEERNEQSRWIMLRRTSPSSAFGSGQSNSHLSKVAPGVGEGHFGVPVIGIDKGNGHGFLRRIFLG